MDVQYNQLNDDLRITLEEICSNCTKMRPIETANIIYGLGKMNCLFTSLPIKSQNSLIYGVINTCDAMDEQELGNTVWGLIGHMVTHSLTHSLTNYHSLTHSGIKI
jgi:hypothetical protein